MQTGFLISFFPLKLGVASACLWETSATDAARGGKLRACFCVFRKLPLSVRGRNLVQTHCLFIVCIYYEVTSSHSESVEKEVEPPEGCEVAHLLMELRENKGITSTLLPPDTHRYTPTPTPTPFFPLFSPVLSLCICLTLFPFRILPFSSSVFRLFYLKLFTVSLTLTARRPHLCRVFAAALRKKGCCLRLANLPPDAPPTPKQSARLHKSCGFTGSLKKLSLVTTARLLPVRPDRRPPAF